MREIFSLERVVTFVVGATLFTVGLWGWDRVAGLTEDLNAEHQRQLVTAAVLVLAGGVGAGLVLAVLVDVSRGRTIRRAIRILEELSTGEADLTRRLPILGTGEAARFAEVFNRFFERLEALLRDVLRTTREVDSFSQDVVQKSRSLERSLTGQAETTNEVTGTSHQINAASKELVRTVKRVTELSERASRAAAEGQQLVQVMEETMEQMGGASNAVSEKLGLIHDKTANISAVVTTITKVADQTNLLSLNAAVEAEKAGEYGRGFSVVAREIRRLADQSAVATLDIEEMVGEMKEAVVSGVESMENLVTEVARTTEATARVSTQLATIIEHVDQLSQGFHAAREEMSTQAMGAEEITEAMDELKRQAAGTVASLENVRTILETLVIVGEQLREELEPFKVRGSDDGAAGPGTTAAAGPEPIEPRTQPQPA